jgi:hypothetical protein
MAPSLRPPKVLDPGPMPRGRHKGAQSVGPGLRELPRTPYIRSSRGPRPVEKVGREPLVTAIRTWKVP